MKITEKAFAKFGVHRWRLVCACDHVEKMTDEMKATNHDTEEHGERFVAYMYVTDSNDSRIDTAEEGNNSDNNNNNSKD